MDQKAPAWGGDRAQTDDLSQGAGTSPYLWLLHLTYTQLSTDSELTLSTETSDAIAAPLRLWGRHTQDAVNEKDSITTWEVKVQCEVSGI